MSDPMAIAMVWDDATRLGGVNTWLFQCVDQLTSRGLDTWVVDLGEQESGQVNVSRWRHRILTLRQRLWESAAGFRARVRREFAAREIRMVLFHEHRFGEDVLRCLPQGFPAANILHIDRPDDRYYQLALELDPWLDEQYCVSPRILEKFQARLPPGRRDRVYYLPLGVEMPSARPARPLPAGSELRLVYAGRIAREQKRVQDIPLFLKRLDHHGVLWRLDVFGGGPEESFLRDALAPWSSRATLHGSRPQAEVLTALENAHALLLFSDFEGLPLILLEAMARTVLPVVTKVPSGVSDLLRDRENARLFPPGEPDAAADILADLAARPFELETLARAARTTAEPFALERCLDAYAARLRNLANRRPKSDQPPVNQAPRSTRAKIADRLPRRLLEAIQ
jgi:glycosyltransferase involved in cell wall biosynthesis